MSGRRGFDRERERETGCLRVLVLLTVSTAIPRRTYRVSSAPRNKAPAGLVSTVMGDRVGIPDAVGIIDDFEYLLVFE